jgi:hypothetical protein
MKPDDRLMHCRGAVGLIFATAAMIAWLVPAACASQDARKPAVFLIGDSPKRSYRASLKGGGPDTVELTNTNSGLKEVVHTYGWYLR